MRLLVDASAFLAVLLDEPERARLARMTRGHEIASPLVLPYEIGNALVSLTRRGRLDPAERDAAFQAYGRIPVRLLETDIGKALKISDQTGLLAYDAYYLEICLRFRLPLLSLDRKMLAAAGALRIPCLEEPA
jgi:predicted nucleic acid-binding protein